MEITVVTTKGQIVIPAKIRARHGIKKGIKIAVTEKQGKIILQPINSEFFEKMAGILSSGPSLSKELLKERKRECLKEEKRCKKS